MMDYKNGDSHEEGNQLEFIPYSIFVYILYILIYYLIAHRYSGISSQWMNKAPKYFYLGLNFKNT